MPAELEDLRDLLDAPELTLPIGGRRYVVTAATAANWLQFQSINAAATRVAAAKAAAETAAAAGEPVPEVDTSGLSQLSDLELAELALGDTYKQMLAGGVTIAELQHAGVTAYFWHLGEPTLATKYWESAGGKAEAAPTTPPKKSTSTSTATANTTPTKAAGSSTPSPKSSSRKRQSPS